MGMFDRNLKSPNFNGTANIRLFYQATALNIYIKFLWEFLNAWDNMLVSFNVLKIKYPYLLNIRLKEAIKVSQ